MAISIDYDEAFIPDAVKPFRVPLRFQVAGAALLIAALLIKVWARGETVDIGYRLAEARQEMVELDRQERSLRYAVAEKTRNDSLRELAVARLGMRPTDKSQVFRIKESS